MPERPPTARPLFEQVLEAAVYVPLGAAARVAEELPALAARGRQLAGSQVESARAVGRFAVSTARNRFGLTLGRPGVPPRPAGGPSSTSPSQAPRTADTRRPAAPRETPAEPDLAIPGYDALAASQVVPLLAGLTAGELEAVRRYEEGHRHRRTVLGRIEQLEQERSDGKL